MGIIERSLDAHILNSADQLAWFADSVDNELATYPGLGWQLGEHRPGPEPFRPDAWSERFHTGFTLALEGEDPATPADLPGYEARAFEAGVVAGRRRREAEIEEDHAEIQARDRRFEEWVEEMERLDGVGEGHDPDEVIRTLGSVEARKGATP